MPTATGAPSRSSGIMIRPTSAWPTSPKNSARTAPSRSESKRMVAEHTIPRTREEVELHERVRTLLDDSSQRDNPMREVLAELLERSEQQRGRLEKLVRISDGYHNVSRTQNMDLIREYDRQIMRLEKLARISDRYQSQLIALNEELKT